MKSDGAHSRLIGEGKEEYSSYHDESSALDDNDTSTQMHPHGIAEPKLENSPHLNSSFVKSTVKESKNGYSSGTSSAKQSPRLPDDDHSIGKMGARFAEMHARFRSIRDVDDPFVDGAITSTKTSSTRRRSEESLDDFPSSRSQLSAINLQEQLLSNPEKNITKSHLTTEQQQPLNSSIHTPHEDDEDAWGTELDIRSASPIPKASKSIPQSIPLQSTISHPMITSSRTTPHETSRFEPFSFEISSVLPTMRPLPSLLKKDSPREKAYLAELNENEEDCITSLENIEHFTWDSMDLSQWKLPERPQITDPKLQQRITDYSLPVMQISEEALHERREIALDSLLADEEERISLLCKTEAELQGRELVAKQRIIKLEEAAETRIRQEKIKMLKNVWQKEADLGRYFRKLREMVEEDIKKRKGVAIEYFGRSLISEYAASRRFHVYTETFPQPVEFRIRCLRAPRERIGAGDYTIMLTQYDSLGGYPLRWTTVGGVGLGDKRPGITKAVTHQGRYFDRNLKFEDSCFALCPPRNLMRPGFVFVLELIQLANSFNPVDKVVGWSAIPMFVENLSLIEGKFKLPLLRGQPNPSVEQFHQIDRLISSDLQNWICNIYFDVRVMSLAELSSDDAMLAPATYDLDYLGKCVLSHEQADEPNNNPLTGVISPLTAHSMGTKQFFAANQSSKVNQSSDDASTIGGAHLREYNLEKGMFRRKLAYPLTREFNLPPEQSRHIIRPDLDEDEGEQKYQQKNKSSWISGMISRVFNRNTRIEPSMEQRLALLQHHQAERDLELGAVSNQHLENAKDTSKPVHVHERGYNLQNSHFLHREQRGKITGIETVRDVDSQQWASASIEGSVIRRWQSEGPRFDSDAILGAEHANNDTEVVDIAPKPEPSFLVADKRHVNNSYSPFQGWSSIHYEHEYREYGMSIGVDPLRRKQLIPGSMVKSKMRYLTTELTGDLVPYMYGSTEYFLSFFLYLAAFWLMIYVHYISQHLFLAALGVPQFGFELHPLFILFKFIPTSVSIGAQAGIVIIGSLGNMIIFVLFFGFGWLFYRVSGVLPHFFSRLFSSYGVMTVLDPILIMIIDVCFHHYDCPSVSDICEKNYLSSECECYPGDFVKLWEHMKRSENSGISGGFLTVTLYLSTMLVGIYLLYIYLVYVHRDGRILDLYNRIHGREEDFFLPDDFELSQEELQYVFRVAREFQGEDGRGYRRIITEDITQRPTSDISLIHGKRVFNPCVVRKYIIYEYNGRNAKGVIHRQFQLYENGKLFEIFDNITEMGQKHFEGRTQISPRSHPVSTSFKEVSTSENNHHVGDQNLHGNQLESSSHTISAHLARSASVVDSDNTSN